MKSNFTHIILVIVILIQGCQSAQKTETLSKTQAVRLFQSSLSLLKQKNNHAWTQARPVLQKVFQSDYLFNAQAYNTAALLLLQMIQHKHFTYKDDIFRFINQQNGFFQHVTLPYFLVSQGHAFDMTKLTVRRKIMVFYFTAPWCSFCKEFRIDLIRWAKENNNVLIREIELFSMHSAAADGFKKLHEQAQHAKIFTPAVFIYRDRQLIYSGSVKSLTKLIKIDKKRIKN